MATKQCHFFATEEDLLPVFDAFEAKQPARYILAGLHQTPKLTMYSSGRDIATLELPAPDANAMGGYNYLVTLPGDLIEVRPRPQNSGGVRYAVDQLANPRTMTVLHGGFFAANVLLNGRAGTVSDDPVALQLYRSFSSALRKRFQRIRGFWVGPRATELLASGCRLTIGAGSPREFDLRHEATNPIA